MSDTQPQVHIVYAFRHQGAGGNGAGVVLDGAGLSRQQKMDIAARVGLSETAFVTPSPKADYHLEYFTPVDEVDLCGHATIATFLLLHRQGLAPGRYTIDTRAGVLQMIIDPDGTVWMQQCCPAFFDTYPAADFMDCIPGIQAVPGLPIQAVSTGLKDILLPVASVDQLYQLQPDFEAMARLNRQQGVVGIHAFALTGGTDPVAVCRNFAPLYGIPEESATGTSNCALACYLHRYGHPASRYRFLQGVNMGCTSAIEVRLSNGEQGVLQVFVGGR